MAKDKKKKRKPGEPVPKRPRNPFAGRPQSGAGYHSESRYGKKDRRRIRKELDEEVPEDGNDPGDGKVPQPGED